MENRSIEEFLKMYLNSLIEIWHANKMNLLSFPYELLNCNSPLEFFINYALDDTVPILLKDENLDLLDQICLTSGITKNEIIKVKF